MKVKVEFENGHVGQYNGKRDVKSALGLTAYQKHQVLHAIEWFSGEGIKPVDVNFGRVKVSRI